MKHQEVVRLFTTSFERSLRRLKGSLYPLKGSPKEVPEFNTSFVINIEC